MNVVVNKEYMKDGKIVGFEISDVKGDMKTVSYDRAIKILKTYKCSNAIITKSEALMFLSHVNVVNMDNKDKELIELRESIEEEEFKEI